MKTTLELPGDLLIEAMIAHSLHREPGRDQPVPDPDLYERNAHGTLILKRPAQGWLSPASRFING